MYIKEYFKAKGLVEMELKLQDIQYVVFDEADR